MAISAIIRNDCRLCGSRKLEVALPLQPSPIADAYLPAESAPVEQPRFSMDLYLCMDCGHVQLTTVVDPEVLFGNYTYMTSSSLGLVEHFRQQMQTVLERQPCAPGAFVAEIGSNDGSLLQSYKEKGFRVLGIDPAKHIAAKAVERGVPTIPEFFSSGLARRLRAEYGPASIFIANNVFAHANNLGDIADGIREMLSGDGLFVFEVSYLVDILQKKLFDTVYHEHLSYHSIKPLVSFLDRHGLKLIDVQRIGTKGGSIRCFAQRRSGPLSVSLNVGELLNLETELALYSLEPYTALSRNLDSIKLELHQLLTQLTNEGKKIAGFGASATVTTLLAQFELAPYLKYIVDDNPSKNGWVCPVGRIPIVGSDALLAKRPDYVVVLAWNYLAPIMKKQAAFIASGGKFITPMPNVKIL